MRRRLALFVASSIACVGALVTMSARANGRFPSAQYFLAGRGTAAGTMLLRATFGVVVSDDDGLTFHYVCEEPLGYAGTAFDPATVTLPDRGILVGIFNGATRIEPDRCTFTPIPSLAGQFITDFDADKSGKVVVASTNTGFIDDTNYIWRSEDGGATFVKLGAGRKGANFVSVEIARTDSKRVWTSGLKLSPRAVFVARSDDGGATLVDSASFPYPDANFAYVSAIDPANADVVYVRVGVTEATGRRTSLLRTADGGLTWRELAKSTGEMLGFALGDDSTTIWYGGPADGLVRSDDAGATWKTLSSTHVRCLRWSDGVLYACGSEGSDVDAGISGDRFSLAASCDRGDTLHPMLGFFEIAGPFACAPGTPESTTCKTRWDDPDGGVKWTFPTDDLPLEKLCAYDAGPETADAGGDANDATATDTSAGVDVADSGDASKDATPDGSSIDAGAAEPSAASSGGGCGCDFPGAASDAAWITIALASTLIVVRAVRRRT